MTDQKSRSDLTGGYPYSMGVRRGHATWFELTQDEVDDIRATIPDAEVVGKYSRAYQKILDIDKEHRHLGLPTLDPATRYWFDKARSINSDIPNDAANVFIREVSAAGKLLDGKPVGNLQRTSNAIGSSVIDDIVASKRVPAITRFLQADIANSLVLGDQKVEGWGGAFYYWNAPYRKDGNGRDVTVGQDILADPVKYDKFLAANARAATDAGKLGPWYGSAATALSAEAPAAVERDILLRRIQGELTGNYVGSPDLVDGYSRKADGTWTAPSPPDSDTSFDPLVATDPAVLSRLNAIRDYRLRVQGLGSFKDLKGIALGTGQLGLIVDKVTPPPGSPGMGPSSLTRKAGVPGQRNRMIASAPQQARLLSVADRDGDVSLRLASVASEALRAGSPSRGLAALAEAASTPSSRAPNTDGNALHRWEEVGPPPGAAEAFAAAHPNVIAVAQAAATVGTSLTGGHAYDDYAHWADPTGRWEPGPLNPLALVAGTADAMQRPIFSGNPIRDLAHGAVDLAKGVAGSVYSGVTLPGDALQGKLGDPDDPHFVERVMPRVFDTVGLMAFPGIGAVAENIARPITQATEKSLAPLGVRLYDIKPVGPRLLEDDYRGKVPRDAAGNLTHDIDGYPFGSNVLTVGRRVVGGDDRALTATELQSVAEMGTGRPVQYTTPGAGLLGRNEAGAVDVAKGSGRPVQVYVSDRLSPDQSTMTLGHEVGHIVDMLAGTIPQKGLSAELKSLYNTTSNQTRNRAGDDAVAFNGTGRTRPVTPENFSYRGDEVAPEYMAEAVRSYMADPGAMKATYPKTAAAIRKATRDSTLLRFNARGDAAAPIALAQHRDQQQDADPLAAVLLAQLDAQAAANPVEVVGSYPHGLSAGQLGQAAPDGHFMAVHGSFSADRTRDAVDALATRAALAPPRAVTAIDGPRSTAPEPLATMQKWADDDPRLNGTLRLNPVGLAAGLGASRAYTAAHDAVTDGTAPGTRASPFDLRGPVVPDGLLPSLLGHAAHQRDAERAVLPPIRSAAASDATPQGPARTASLDLDRSGIHEAIHHVRTLKAELASLGTASVSVRHRGFGTRGDHAPGAVRSALNGNFGSDGRAFS